MLRWKNWNKLICEYYQAVLDVRLTLAAKMYLMDYKIWDVPFVTFMFHISPPSFHIHHIHPLHIHPQHWSWTPRLRFGGSINTWYGHISKDSPSPHERKSCWNMNIDTQRKDLLSTCSLWSQSFSSFSVCPTVTNNFLLP